MSTPVHEQTLERMNTPGKCVSLLIRAVVDRMRTLAVIVTLAMCASCAAHAAVALLLEEPYGRFGAFNPTGHAAVYLSRVCADQPTRLRMCRPDEYGSVISRYHKIHGYDWIAMPLIPYLYATESAEQVPDWIDKQQVAELRDAYRRSHLQRLAPDTAAGTTPRGEWVQLVGSSYDRTIYGFEIATTSDQDARFIALFNDRRDVSHFNLFFHNCADFSRDVLNTYIPGLVRRNFIADVGLTTPKQVARSLAKYGETHPDAAMSTFVIPQVQGSVKRSHPVNGVTESLVKSKKYLIPLAVLSPSVTGTVAAAYLLDGRFKMPKQAAVFDLEDARVKPDDIAPANGPDSHSSPESSLSAADVAGDAARPGGGVSESRSSVMQQ